MPNWKERAEQADPELADALQAMLKYIAKRELPARVYSELMAIFGFDHRLSLDRNTFGAALGLVSLRSLHTHRVMLSVLVVLKGEERVPSTGFFDLADDCGYRKPRETDETLATRATAEVYRAYASADKK